MCLVVPEVVPELRAKNGTGSGEVAVRSIGGEAEIKTGSGDIGIGHLGGPARLTTGSGDIEVGRADGPISVKTGSGDIVVRDAEGGQAQLSAGSELGPMVDDAQRERLLRGLFESFYADRAEPVVFDTNRAWTAKLPLLMRLFPEAKVVCCVRDVAWVLDSLERRFRANAFEHTRLFNSAAERATVYTRVEALAAPNRPAARAARPQA